MTRVPKGVVLVATMLAATWLALAGCGSTKKPVESVGSTGASASDGGAATGSPPNGGAGGADSGPRRICDGSSGIRLAFTYAVGTGSVEAFTSVLYDVGTDFLYVDGNCNYWIGPLGSANDEYRLWRAYRSGTLSDDQERDLHDSVGYDDVGTGPVARSCQGEHSQDQSIAQLWDGARSYICNAMLQVPQDWPIRKELLATAEDLSGPMRIQVGIDAVASTARVYTWPLATSPEELAVDYDSTDSVVVADPDAVAALRRLRAQVLDDAMKTPGAFSGRIVAEPPGYIRGVADETYVLTFRDELPFTGPKGTWAPPF